jgi:hypothetical protein
VWDLLARRPQPRISQDFMAQVLEEMRATPQETLPPSNVVAFPAPRRSGFVWAGLAAAAAVALGLFLHFQTTAPLDVMTISEDPAASVIASNDDASLEQELTAVQDVHALMAVEDPTELNDAQLFAFLN